MSKVKLQFVMKCLWVMAIPFLFNFCFVSDIQSYTRIMIHELYQDGDIDVLLLGASHTYRSVDVSLIESETGLNVFNAGTSSQQLQGSYYLLKEAHETNGVRTVLLDVTYTIHQLNEPGKTQTYIIADYLKKYKYEYLYRSFGIDGLINGLLPFLHGFDLSPTTVQEHITGTYRNNSYDYVTYANEAYVGQGFVYSFEVVPEDYVFNNGIVIDPDHLISEFSMDYLNQIISYCQDQGIELILVNPPMPDGTLISAQNFQLYVDAIKELALQNQLTYWDFNLAKKDVLTMDRTDFKDDEHLNGAGAVKFTRCVSRALKGELSDGFYETFLEKITHNPDNTLN